MVRIDWLRAQALDLLNAFWRVFVSDPLDTTFCSTPEFNPSMTTSAAMPSSSREGSTVRSGSDEKEETLREEEVSTCEQEPRTANR
jgi:hypothetical protein